MTTRVRLGEIAVVEEDFSALLVRARGGDAAALGELHARYERLVVGVVRRRLGPALRRRSDTADFAQSVFEDVIRDLPRFEDRGETEFRHWLSLKAENKVRDAWRRTLGRGGAVREGTPVGVTEDPADGRAGPATRAGEADDALRLRAVLAALPAEQRRVLSLRDDEGLGFDAIAKRMDLPGADAARMRYARALLALRERWSAH